jgi:ATP-dependent DNA helicase RecG
MTSNKLRIFVSSVQKELENERLTVLALVTTDPFLCAQCDAFLYEHTPASAEKSTEGCIKLLESCNVCLSIVGQHYGNVTSGSLSITHQEYQRAKSLNLPVLIFIKGEMDAGRDTGTKSWINEIRADKLKYKRFGNILELQREVRAALLKLLKDRYNLVPSSEEQTIAEQTLEAVSAFESQALKRLKWQNLDQTLARRLTARAEQKPEADLSENDILESMMVRGLTWPDSETDENYGTAAGIVLLARDPSAVFPHCRFLVDAYRAIEPDGDPIDHDDIRGPMPAAINLVINFIDRNTRHPMKIVGLDRVRLDEYPAEALREALVNAAAHRNYEDAGRKIMVEVFPDRVVISSPGMPPKPLTLQKLRSGKYKPCSRNPVIAQSLSYFHRIEERGSGFKRMRAYMIDHGLEEPILTEDTGYFQVVFKGPGKDIKKIKPPLNLQSKLIPLSIESQLNKRQKRIIEYTVSNGSVTRSWCMKTFKIGHDSASRDLSELVIWDMFITIGKGRAIRYVLKNATKKSSDNRPIKSG